MQTALFASRPSSDIFERSQPSSDIGGDRYFIELKAPFPSEDVEGEIYESVGHAREDAIHFLADLLKDRAREIRPGEAWQVVVSDERANVVFRLNFSAEAVV